MTKNSRNLTLVTWTTCACGWEGNPNDAVGLHYDSPGDPNNDREGHTKTEILCPNCRAILMTIYTPVKK